MTGKEVAELTGVSERSIRRYASSSNDGTVNIKGSVYHFRLIDGVGGRGKVFDFWIGENDGSETKSTSTAERSGGVDQGREDASDERKNSGGCSILNDLHTRSLKSSKTSRLCSDEKAKSIDPREALKLSDAKRSDAELRCRLVMEFEKRPKGMTIESFIGELSIDYESLNVTTSKINRWLGAYRKAKKQGSNVIVALADNSGRPKGITKLTDDMKKMTVRYLLRQDVHLSVSGIYSNLQHAFGDVLPSRNTVNRFIEEWKAKNVLQWAVRVSPDKAKSKYMPAWGSLSENIKYKNQVWELDGTIADVVTVDAKRWTIVGAIDVFSRRVVVTLEESNTSFALARNMRKAIIKLGIPDVVLTDNGKDYKSNHFSSICLSLGIEQKFTHPYSGDQKPHIERFFGTLTRELFQSIEGFCGNSVAQRQAIQSGLSFEDRLKAIDKWKAKSYSEEGFKKLLRKKDQYGGLPIEVPLTPQELASWIDRWVNTMYEQGRHSMLKMSPMQKWESDFTPAQSVGNLRSLDFLLGESKYRMIEKKGIVYSKDGYKGQYWHPALAEMEGAKVMTIEPDEMGELLIYTEDREFVCVAEDPTLKGQSREKAAVGKRIFNKRMRQAKVAIVKATEASKALNDPLIVDQIIEMENELGISMPEMRTPKQTKEIVAANAVAEAKSRCEVKEDLPSEIKWKTHRERFIDKMMSRTWDDKDTALSERYPTEYERALEFVANHKKAG